jgi:hypothetical protein
MNSNDLVKNILKRDVDEQDRILKSTEVIKPCPVDIDLGNLLVWDPNVIDQQAYKYVINEQKKKRKVTVRTYLENFSTKISVHLRVI